MSKELELTPFRIDRETADSLRLELSGNSPQKEAEIIHTGAQIRDRLIALYGRYMAREKIEEAKDIERRAFIIPSDLYDRAYNTWVYPSRDTEGWWPESFAGYFRIGQIVTIAGPERAYELYKDSNCFSKIQYYFGDRAGVEEALRRGQNFFLAHEICHHFISHSNDKNFREYSAHYYAYQVTRSLGLDCFPWIYDRQIRFYKELVDGLGDQVHRLAFGTEKNPKKQNQIRLIYKEKVLSYISRHC